MKFSIVTPSYNQADYLEQCLRSVIQQKNVNLEYIVCDGGSTDASVEIIQRYENHLSAWTSERDNGQADAIIKGFRKASGDILAWINSDDYYEEGALERVAEIFAKNPDVVLVYGDYYVEYPGGEKVLKKKVSWDQKIALYAYLMIPQPSSFWRKSAYDAVSGLNPDFHFAMDYDFFLRMGEKYPNGIKHIPVPLSTFRVHDSSKSVSQKNLFKNEHTIIRSQFSRDSRFVRKLKGKFYLLKILLKFWSERRMIPLKKDQSKA